jgi:hypothetical protein
MDQQHPLGVVTPTLDGDVLRRLALADTAFTPGQLQRLVPHASVVGIRKVLHRLTEQGIVTAVPVGGSAVCYALNREHLAAAAVLQLADPTASLRRRLSALVEGWPYPPTYLCLFGSWARGEAGLASDVDLFLVRPPDAPDEVWEQQVASLETSTTRWTGNDARSLVLDEWHLPDPADDPMLGSILREGITLHGSATWLRAALIHDPPTTGPTS